jgi:hypothetical protein
MTITALEYLKECDAHLNAARDAAEAATGNLSGARRTRAEQLVHETIPDSIAFCQRLSFVVQAVRRASAGQLAPAFVSQQNQRPEQRSAQTIRRSSHRKRPGQNYIRIIQEF